MEPLADRVLALTLADEPGQLAALLLDRPRWEGPLDVEQAFRTTMRTGPSRPGARRCLCFKVSPGRKTWVSAPSLKKRCNLVAE